MNTGRHDLEISMFTTLEVEENQKTKQKELSKK